VKISGMNEIWVENPIRPGVFVPSGTSSGLVRPAGVRSTRRCLDSILIVCFKKNLTFDNRFNDHEDLQKKILVCFFVVLSLAATCQDVQVSIDNLKSLLNKTSDPVTQIDLLLQLTKKTRSIYPDQAEAYAHRALLLAKQENLPQFQVRAMIETGYILVNKTKIDSSLKIATEAMHMAEVNKLVRDYGMAILLIGLNQNYLGNFEESLINFYNAYGIFERINDQEGTILALNSIGAYCYQQKNNEKALYYYNKALGKARSLKNTELISSVLNNLGLVLSSGNQKEKAAEYFKEAITRNKRSGYLMRLARATTLLNRTSPIVQSFIQRKPTISVLIKT
jgi:tetratricopeptide (TPR) repeat protein